MDPRCTCEGVVSDALPHEQTVLLLKSRTLDPDPGILVESRFSHLKSSDPPSDTDVQLGSGSIYFSSFFLRSDSVHL